MTNNNSILKWVGGKRRLLPEIEARMPESFNRYFEPFVGGGALFFNLNPENAVINDVNSELANFYKQLKTNPNELRLLSVELEHAYNSACNKNEFFVQKRAEFNNNILSPNLGLNDAALMMFLNRTGFNGFYKCNKKGLYNVSWNHHKKIDMKTDEYNLFSSKLQNATILSGDFEDACKDAKAGDFVYFDSPYDQTFDKYQSDGFGYKDHVRLAKLFKELTERGVYCMLSNSNTELIRELYSDYNIDVINIQYTVGCNSSTQAEEVLITNYRRADNQLSFDL